MSKNIFNRLVGICAFCVVVNTFAAEERPMVVPAHEHQIAQQKQMAGPDKTKGIASVTLLGTVGLEKDFPALSARQLRARELVIDPGGVVAVHQHDARPGVAYILEGEIIEHRNDSDKSIIRTKGAVAFEQSGVAHWWENVSDKTVKALVVDIVPTTK